MNDHFGRLEEAALSVISRAGPLISHISDTADYSSSDKEAFECMPYTRQLLDELEQSQRLLDEAAQTLCPDGNTVASHLSCISTRMTVLSIEETNKRYEGISALDVLERLVEQLTVAASELLLHISPSGTSAIAHFRRADSNGLAWVATALHRIELPLRKEIALARGKATRLNARKVPTRTSGRQSSTTAHESPVPNSAGAPERQSPAAKAADREAKERAAIAALLTIGANVAEIARRIGVKRTTLLGWKRFREQLDKVQGKAAPYRERRRGGRDGGRDFSPATSTATG